MSGRYSSNSHGGGSFSREREDSFADILSRTRGNISRISAKYSAGGAGGGGASLPHSRALITTGTATASLGQPQPSHR